MATVYGNTVQHWRAKIVADTTSTTNTQVTVRTRVYFCSIEWGYDVAAKAEAEVGSYSSGEKIFNAYSATGASVETLVATCTHTYNRSTSAQSITCKGTVQITGGYHNGTSSKSTTISVPALASYKVTYNANGGSGAPSAQTKYYGRTLTLSSTKPTRSGYTFQGWSTSSTGSVEYNAGGSYTGNKAITLYAVWKINYIAPSVTDAFAYRVSSNTSTTEDATGLYAYCSFTWKVDTSVTSGNTSKTVAIQYKQSGAAAYSNATVSGTTSGATSGTTTGRFAVDQDKSYEVKFSVTDNSGQSGSTVSVTRYIGTGHVPFQLTNGGKGMGLLAAAPDEGVRIGGTDFYVKDNKYTTDDLNTLLVNVNYVKYEITSFSTGFKVYSNDYKPTAYRQGDVVVFNGAFGATGETVSSNTEVTMATLPVGFRPTTKVFSLCQGSGKCSWLLVVNPDGSVTFSRYGTTTNEDTPSNPWLTVQACWVTNDAMPS